MGLTETPDPANFLSGSGSVLKTKRVDPDLVSVLDSNPDLLYEKLEA
jgi:hypothetical protein